MDYMKDKSEKQFRQLLKKAKSDPNILCFFLGGSRGKGFNTKDSDYDIYIITKENVAKNYKSKYKKVKSCDVVVLSKKAFEKYANIGSEYEWDRYDFAHVKALIDKDDIQKIIDEKGTIPKNRKNKFIDGYLDGYINYVYRSIKCIRNGNKIGARLEAAQSIKPLLNAVFALENRVVPFFDYVNRELEKYPLKKLPWKSEDFLDKLLLILSTADLKTQQEVLKKIEKLFTKEGFGAVFDRWKPNRWIWVCQQP